ncbi:hypothetical protein [Arthrobacter sp. MA-N2]|uniref:hypothetical protein n=1 Tax=Arthrobacter sp. MA-N2 TaxID=1101188 RepID=UPI0004883417|nr:hypothetical protein [Arthrobacter sp. MA-N2]
MKHFKDHSEDPAAVLEPGQLSTAKSLPVAPAELSPGTRRALWALRIFVVMLAILVTYTFIVQLTQ